MRRCPLFFGVVILSGLFSGCGDSNAVVPEDGSNLPPEVKEAEDKMAAQAAKRQEAGSKKSVKTAPH